MGTVAAATAFTPSAALAAVKQTVEVANDMKKMVGIGAVGVALAASAVGYKAMAGGNSATANQDFLETSPYWDQSAVPVNTFKNKAPFTGKVVSTKRIVGPKATGETCHIIIDHNGTAYVSSVKRAHLGL